MKKAFNSVFKNKSNSVSEKSNEDKDASDKDRAKNLSSQNLDEINVIKIETLPPTPTSNSKLKSNSSTALESNFETIVHHQITGSATKRYRQYSSQDIEHHSEMSQKKNTNDVERSEYNGSIGSSIEFTIDPRIQTNENDQPLALVCSINDSTIVPNGSPTITFESRKTVSAAKLRIVKDEFCKEKSYNANHAIRKTSGNGVSLEERSSSKDYKSKVETNDATKTNKVTTYRQDSRQKRIGDAIHSQQTMTKSSAFKISTEELSTGKRSFESQRSEKVITHGIRHEETSSSRFTSKSYKTMSITSSSSNIHVLPDSESVRMTSESPIITEPFSPGVVSNDQESIRMIQVANDPLSFKDDENVSTYANKISTIYTDLLENLQNVSNKEESLDILTKLNQISAKASSNPQVARELNEALSNTLRDSGGLDVLIENCGLDVNPEVQFQSAKLIQQNLSPANRSYIVENSGLSDVVELACSFANNNLVSHERVGTGILEELFKHSEEMSKEIIKLGGLKAIVYKCRISDIETLRHCAAALANLSLYGGQENHEAMIRAKAPAWLFPLALHDDDSIKYYAFLATAALMANKEIEASVLSSGTHELIEPFLSTRSPAEFVSKSKSKIKQQSKKWLEKLSQVLDSDRNEACSLAAFHFAVEALIRKTQGKLSAFYEIGVVDKLKKVASSPNALASKYAAHVLKIIGEEIPHKLSQQVPLWRVEDVKEWVKQIGFSQYIDQFVNSQVDGDLLLQIDDEMLKNDISITNGILRRRFLRELGHLKRIADYSSCDSANLFNTLNSLGQIYAQYTYSMLQGGVDADNLLSLSEDQLLKDCKIENSIHRLKIAETIKNLNLKEIESEHDLKPLDVFISYRRSSGSQLASLLKVHLQLRGFTVFIDIERLEAGKFDSNLLSSIKQAKNFILVLTPNSLDRCLGDVECKDWVHKEIFEALQNKCNIIPILDDFQWPEAESFPEDIKSICYFNGVRWIHEYQDACVDKLERFMRGEINSRNEGILSKGVAIHGVPGTPSTPNSMRSPSYPRTGSVDKFTSE